MQSSLNLTQFSRFAKLTLGKVSKLYPEANMVDVLLLDGTILNQVQVMTSYASSRAGVFSLPLMKYKEKSLYDKTQPLLACERDESDVFAVVAFFEDEVFQPLVFGFLFPEENEILCSRNTPGNEDGTMFLWKHDSNTYIRVAKGVTGEPPEIEVSHPSGTFLKVGKGGALTQVNNYDKRTRPFNALNPETKQKDPDPQITLMHSSGTSIIIDPDGNVSVNCEGNYTLNVKGTYTETIAGVTTRNIGSDENDSITGNWTRSATANIQDKASQIKHNGSGSPTESVMPEPVAEDPLPEATLNTSYTNINAAIAAGDLSTVLSGPGSLTAGAAAEFQQEINQNANLGWTETSTGLNVLTTEVQSNAFERLMGSFELNSTEMTPFVDDWKTNILDNSNLGISSSVLNTQVSSWMSSLNLNASNFTSVLSDIKNALSLSFNPATLAAQFVSDNISKLDLKSMVETKMMEFNISPTLLNNVDSWKSYAESNSLTGGLLLNDWKDKVLDPLGIPEDTWGQVNGQVNVNKLSGTVTKYTEDSSGNVVDGDVLPRNYESTFTLVKVPSGDWKVVSKEEAYY